MSFISIVHIKQIQNYIGAGITEPTLALSDDGTLVVIKKYNCIEGNLVLFNEYICYRLAIRLGIQMPESGVCVIDENTEINVEGFDSENYGFGFYSTYIHKTTNLVPSIIPLMNNSRDFFKILLFDHVVFNPDRNPGNLLVQFFKKNISLQVIDHTHVFINQAIWDKYCLTRAIEDKDYYSTDVLCQNKELYEMFFSHMKFVRNELTDILKSFQENITYDIIWDIINDMPIEWLPIQDDLDALVDYLLYRVNHLDDICITIENYLNNN